MSTFQKIRAFLYFFGALAIALIGAALAQADDAPRLGGASLLIALALVLCAARLLGWLRPRSSRIIFLCILGVLALVAPFVLYADGEIAWPSPFWLALLLGAGLLGVAWKLWCTDAEKK